MNESLRANLQKRSKRPRRISVTSVTAAASFEIYPCAFFICLPGNPEVTMLTWLMLCAAVGILLVLLGAFTELSEIWSHPDHRFSESVDEKHRLDIGRDEPNRRER